MSWDEHGAGWGDEADAATDADSGSDDGQWGAGSGGEQWGSGESAGTDAGASDGWAPEPLAVPTAFAIFPHDIGADASPRTPSPEPG